MGGLKIHKITNVDEKGYLRKSMIVVNHVIKLIVQCLYAMGRDVTNTVRRLEERLKTWGIMLHAMVNINLTPAAHLGMRLREVNVIDHVGAVMIEALCELLLMLVLLLLLLLLLLGDAIFGVQWIPHLE